MTSTPAFPAALRKHDPLKIAAGAAALSLIPGNANHGARINALVLEALAQPIQANQRINKADWINWLHQSPSLHGGPPWDPPDGLWTVPIAAPGGSLVLPTGA